MSEQSLESILKNLSAMAASFNYAADCKEAADRQVAKLLQEAANALRVEQQKNLNLQQQLNAFKALALAKLLKGKKFTFLIDGSGSMYSDASALDGKTPIGASIDAVSAFSRAGAAVTAGLWGDKSVQIIEDLEAFDVRKGLNIGTDFAPAVDFMQAQATIAKGNKRFIVLSDGDIFDREVALAKAEKLLQAPKVTVDFVVMAANNSYMNALAQKLQDRFPNQVSLQIVLPGQSVDDVLGAIAALRTQGKKANAVKTAKP